MRPVGLLSFVFACVFATGCSAQEVKSMVGGRGHVEKIEEEYTVEPGGTLTIDADFGEISIETWDENKVDVLVEKRIKGYSDEKARQELEDVEVEVSQHANDVRIEVNRSSWFKKNRVSVRMKVHVPLTYNLDLKTAGGDIDVADLKGDVKAATAGGDVTIGTVTEGDIKASTAGGDIEVRGGGRETALSTAGGNITVDSAEGGVTARTTGGNIEIGDTGGDVDTKTTGGNIEIGTVKGNVTSKTTGGNLEIGAIFGDVDAKTVGGNIEIDDVQGKVNTNAVGGRVTVGSL